MSDRLLRRAKSTLVGLLFVMSFVGNSLYGANILIDSFESPVVTGRIKTNVPGWIGTTLSGVSTDRVGNWNVSSNTMTTPYGDQAAWIWHQRSLTTTAISETLTADTIYTLSFNLAAENGEGGIVSRAEILAGGTVIASQDYDPLTTNDFSVSQTLTLGIASTHPQLGQTLSIRFSYVSGQWQRVLGVDNVSFTSELNSNQAPVAIAGGNISSSVATVQLDGSGTYDPDGDDLTYHWSGSNGAWFSPSPNVESPVAMIGGFGVRSETLTLTVTDSLGLVSTDQMDVHVTTDAPGTLLYDTFEEPVVADREQTLIPGWDGTNVSNGLPDSRVGHWNVSSNTMTTPYGDQAAWIWNQRQIQTEPLNSVLEGDRVYTLNFNVASEEGLGGIEFTASLMAGNAVVASQSFGPVVSNDFSEAYSLVLGTTSTHPNFGEPLSVKFSYDSGNWQYVLGIENVHLTYELNSNQAPVANAGLDINSPIASVQLDSSATVDPDGDQLTYEWSGTGVWFNPSPNVANPVVMLEGSGVRSKDITLTVTDPLGLSSTDIVTVNVTQPVGGVVFFDGFETPQVTGKTGLLPTGWTYGDGPTSYNGLWNEDSGVFTTYDGIGLDQVWDDGQIITPSDWHGTQAASIFVGRELQSSTITSVLEAETNYDLSMHFGAEDGMGSLTYLVELFAGSNVIASTTGGPLNLENMSNVAQLSFSTDISHPNLGETLSVKITNNSPGWQKKLLVDSVKLTATSNTQAETNLTITTTPFNSVSTEVTITSEPTSGVTIRYTDDGTTPNLTSPIYTGALTYSEETIIRAILIDSASEIIAYDSAEVFFPDLSELYARKTYGMGAQFSVGGVRRFEGQVWWAGPDGVPDEMGGDDVRMPQYDDDIIWTCSGGEIVKTTTTPFGGAAIYYDDGMPTGYRVTLKIGPNSYTGCTNVDPASDECDTDKDDDPTDDDPEDEDKDEGDGDDDDGGDEEGEKEGDEDDKKKGGKKVKKKGFTGLKGIVNLIKQKKPGDRKDRKGRKGEEGGEEGGGKGAGNGGGNGGWGGGGAHQGGNDDGVVAGDADDGAGCSPISLPTVGYTPEFHINFDSGSYDLRSFSFGKATRLTFFHELKVISETQVNVYFSELKTPYSHPSWMMFKLSSGKYRRIYGPKGKGLEASITKVSETEYLYTGADGRLLTFKDIPQDNSDTFRLTKFVDKNGNEITIDFISVEGVVVTDATGNKYVIEATHDFEGYKLITKITTVPHNSTETKNWTYTYTSEGTIKSEKFEELYDEYGYGEYFYSIDRHGNYTSFTDYRGLVENYSYDDAWRGIGVENAFSQSLTQTRTSPNGNYTKITTDPEGNKTTYKFAPDVSGFLMIEKTDAEGLKTYYEYTPEGDVSKRTEKVSGNVLEDIVTEYEYNAQRRLIKKIVDPSGLNLVDEYSYDQNGNLVQTIDANGVITTFSFDSNNRKTSKTVDPGGLNLTRSWEYDNYGNLIKETDELGKEWRWVYDSFGKKIQSINELGHITSYTYDAFGNRATKTDRNGNVTTYEYDSFNRLKRKIDAQGYVRQYEYDGNDNLTRVIDELGAITVFEYNDLNQRIKISGDASGPGGCGSCGGSMANGLEGDYVYNWNGMLLSFTDVQGLTVSFEYDKVYRNTKVVKDPLGLALTSKKEYDLLGRTIRTISVNDEVSGESDDVISEFVYDKANRVVTIKDVIGSSTNDSHFIYDNYGNIISVTDSNGNSTYFEYDNNYRLLKTTDAEGLIVESVYNGRSELISSVVDPTGFNYTTIYEYDDAGRLIRVTEPDGGITTMVWDDYGNLLSETDPNSNTSTWTYDSRNLVSIATDPGGFSTSFTYDGLRNVLTVTDANGTVTKNSYDYKSFRTSTVQDFGGIEATTFFTRDEYLNPVMTTDASGTKFLTEYDKIYRPIFRTGDLDGAEVTTEIFYDSLNRIKKEKDAGGFETIWEYDQLSRLVRQINPDGGEIFFTYDNFDNILTKTVKVNSSESVVTKYEYDKVYRVVKTIEDFGGKNITTDIEYDLLGRTISTTDSNSNTTSYSYDEEGRVLTETYADGGIVTMSYDLKGRLLTRIDQNGELCTYTYNSRDLLVQKSYGLSGIQTFTYDALGRMTQDTDNNGGSKLVTCDYTYDSLHRNLTETQKVGASPAQTITKTFDDYGHELTCTYPSGRVVTKTYTPLHQVDQIFTSSSNGQQLVTDYTYEYEDGDSDKRMVLEGQAFNSSTNVTLAVTVDEMGRTLGRTYSKLGTTQVGFSHTYNLMGQRTRDEHLHNPGDSENYTYDSARRFDGYTRDDGFAQNWTLDDLGNWVQFDNDGVVENRTHSSTNEVETSSELGSITYDDNGNMILKGTDIFVWDTNNRLVAVNSISGSKASYAYNAMNQRVYSNVDSDGDHILDEATTYYYCGQRVCEEQDDLGVYKRDYVHGGQFVDEVVMTSLDANKMGNFTLTDLRYSVYAIIDVNGTVLERYKYDPYGKRTIMGPGYGLLSSSAINQEFGYTGRRHDEATGLMYFRARYYDSDLGRFIGRDPLGYVDGMSLYRGYFAVNGLDPWGLCQEMTDAVVTNMIMGQQARTFQGLNRAQSAAQASFAHEALTEVAQVVPFLEATVNIMDGEYQKAFGNLVMDVTGTKALKLLGKVVSKVTKVAKAPSGICFVAGTLVSTAYGGEAIENLVVGQRVLTSDSESQPSDTEIDDETWRKVSLEMPNPDGSNDTIYIETLKSLDWINGNNCVVGESIEFALEEMGLFGSALVVKIEDCPDIQDGVGRVIHSTVTHYNGNLYRIRLESGVVVEPTGRHLLYSMDKNDWVQTKNLSAGETLRTKSGSSIISSIEKVSGIHQVYNIEVETEHCYYVSSDEVLSHNVNPCAMPAPNTPKVTTPHTTATSGKAPKTSTPNSIHEVQRADGSSSVTYYDEKGRMFSREDYGQQRTHGVLGRGPDGKSVPHEHKVNYSDRGPIGKEYRQLDDTGKPVGPWHKD